MKCWWGAEIMKNKITDLNNHLFAQLERLGDEDIKGDKLTEEINRAKAVVDVAEQIIAVGSLTLKAKIAATEYKLIAPGKPQKPGQLARLLLGEGE
jgi:hypothetical protein